MERNLADVFPVMDVEQDAILSRQGDMSIAYKMQLPEIFSLSDMEYEAFHQAWARALKVLPKNTIFHKQDWFIESKYRPDLEKSHDSFLSLSSERFFNERPFLNHSCYLVLTKMPNTRKSSNSLFSTLLKRSMVPDEMMKPESFQELSDAAAQFKRIMEDTGIATLKRMRDDDLLSVHSKAGLIERSCFLLSDDEEVNLKDIQFKNRFEIGDKHCALFTLADVQDLPSLCGPRINFDKYSTDRTKFSIGSRRL